MSKKSQTRCGYVGLLLYGLLFTIAGCGREADFVEEKGGVEETPIIVRLYSKSTSPNKLRSLAKQGIKVAEARLKVARGSRGEVARLNQERTLTNPSSLVQDLLAIAQRIWESSNGYYDYRMGKVVDLWKQGAERRALPSESELQLEADRARATSYEQVEDRLKLKGEGKLEFGFLVLGWAADGAYDTISRLAVTHGWVDVGGVRRIWGKPPQGDDWELRFPDTALDSVEFIMTLPAGGWAMVHSKLHSLKIDKASYVLICDPITGQTLDSLEAVGVWGPTAVEASALAQAFWVMGRIRALDWVSRHPGFGLVVLYGKGLDRVAETDLTLSERISLQYISP